VAWHLAQGLGGANPAWPARLVVSSWAKAFVLAELALAAPPDDVMLGAPMLLARAALAAPRGSSHCIVLPQRDGGVKVVGVLPAAAGRRLRDGGAAVEMFCWDGRDGTLGGAV
jgi:hypothetical protein